MTDYFMAHGMTDPSGARHKAIIALGKTVKQQAQVMGFSDPLAVVGIVLLLAGIALLPTGKPKGAIRRRALGPGCCIAEATACQTFEQNPSCSCTYMSACFIVTARV